MRTVFLSAPDDFEGWRDAARSLALSRVPPEDVLWQAGDAPTDLFGDEAVIAAPADTTAAFTVPRAFVALARDAICHSDPERFALLYALLLRLRDQPRLIEDHADPLLRRIEELAKAVRRDVHKMRAFLRFREVDDDGHVRFVAWFEPEHHIVRINAGFFVRRFATMRWSILTPDLSIHWDGETVSEAPGATKADAPQGDPIEETWKTYYASIFNPARVKIGAMLKEMPKKYWKNMPETALVPGLIAGAQAQESGMIAQSDEKMARRQVAEARMAQDRTTDTHMAMDSQPDLLAVAARADVGGNSRLAWEALRDEAAGCTRCPLHTPATQTVFGEGPVDARLMFVGEQPGDQEDLAGRPFVGPAGQLFDKALAAAGVDRATVYVTNAVKHFKFEPRGKRRIHATPKGPEIEACRWWIERERSLIRPPLTVALGATAARSLLGKAVTITAARGHPHRLEDGGEAWVTVHPSYLLRIPDRAKADEEYARFVEDLRAAGERLAAMAG